MIEDISRDIDAFAKYIGSVNLPPDVTNDLSEFLVVLSGYIIQLGEVIERQNRMLEEQLKNNQFLIEYAKQFEKTVN